VFLFPPQPHPTLFRGETEPPSRKWAVAVLGLLVLVSSATLVVLEHSQGAVGSDSNYRVSAGRTPSAAALKVRLTASPSTLSLGKMTNLTAIVTGGTPWYRFVWAPLPIGCTSANTSSLNCTPTEAGTYSPSVTVTDSAGRTASNATSIVVSGSQAAASSPPMSAATLYLFAGTIGVAAAVVTALVLVSFGRRRRRRAPPVSNPENPYVPPQDEEQS
jgi:hypothetical protein